MHRVLLLNRSHEPLAVINEQRAVSLIIRGRVEAACEEAFELRSISRILRVPAVMRLRRYVQVPRRTAHWSRGAVLRRDRTTCAYCGARPGDRQRGRLLTRSDFTVDHVVPVSRGGQNRWTNTVCACLTCNLRKADRTPREANMRLLWRPMAPQTICLLLPREIPAAWRDYLEAYGYLPVGPLLLLNRG